MALAMSRRPRVDLATFDGQLLDGLDFCRKAYDLFDQVRSGPDGVTKLRLRQPRTVKRLIEELIPIARYVQARYREGRRIKVRWYSGSQPFDAILWSSGVFVEKGFAPRKRFVEVTTAPYHNEHLDRRRLVFGEEKIPHGSKPSVRGHTANQLATELGDQILERLKKKSLKNYAPGTVLLVYCIPDTLILPSEWDDAIEQVRRTQLHRGFREVFLFDTLMANSATLYGDPKRRQKIKIPQR